MRELNMLKVIDLLSKQVELTKRLGESETRREELRADFMLAMHSRDEHGRHYQTSGLLQLKKDCQDERDSLRDEFDKNQKEIGNLLATLKVEPPVAT